MIAFTGKLKIIRVAGRTLKQALKRVVSMQLF